MDTGHDEKALWLLGLQEASYSESHSSSGWRHPSQHHQAKHVNSSIAAASILHVQTLQHKMNT
jgi:hypothetical protein